MTVNLALKVPGECFQFSSYIFNKINSKGTSQSSSPEPFHIEVTPSSIIMGPRLSNCVKLITMSEGIGLNILQNLDDPAIHILPLVGVQYLKEAL